MSQNLLKYESSLYLQQHSTNLVDWHPWGVAALHKAKQEKLPILLSIGYSACHWCHVMSNESFEDSKTASLMNQLFINIKVDREERPDIDQIYQRAISLMGQSGGWPLTMFLTSEGFPFWGGTYFPKTRDTKKPAFRDVLTTIHEKYTNEPETVQLNQDALITEMRKLSDNKTGHLITESQIQNTAQTFLHEIDPCHGGFGNPPKFPQIQMLQLLWRNYKRTGEVPMKDAVLLSMTNMSKGGIYDHLGGGYARYSTDKFWLIPHFEKMLSDNAQILELLCHVWQETQAPLFRERTIQTIEWIKTEMTTKEGGFASALDADTNREEGSFYVWTVSEIDSILGKNSQAFKDYYNVTSEGNFKGKNILNCLNTTTTNKNELENSRRKMLMARKKRNRPNWDDKILTDWNGQTIYSLAFASAVFKKPEWLTLAEGAWTFIIKELGDQIDNADIPELKHSARHGKTSNFSFLDDYADMCRAGLMLYELSSKENYKKYVEYWIKILDQKFWDDTRGGYYYTPKNAEGLIIREKSIYDLAKPSGNGTLVGVLLHLYSYTHKTNYLVRAKEIIEAFSGELENKFAPVATLINNSELLHASINITIVGRREDPCCESLIETIFSVSLPNRTLMVIDPKKEFPKSHPASGKNMHGNKAKAFVCIGRTCSMPITDPSELYLALNNIQYPTI